MQLLVNDVAINNRTTNGANFLLHASYGLLRNRENIFIYIETTEIIVIHLLHMATDNHRIILSISLKGFRMKEKFSNTQPELHFV